MRELSRASERLTVPMLRMRDGVTRPSENPLLIWPPPDSVIEPIEQFIASILWVSQL